MLPDSMVTRINKQPNGCWIWTGGTTKPTPESRFSYGSYNYEGTQWRVHRLTYTLLVGPIPEGLVLDHLCKVTLCCNPMHLEPVTQKINVHRSESPTAKNMRKTHCVNGHEFTPENTAMVKGGRKCKRCDVIIHMQRYRAKYGYPEEGRQRRAPRNGERLPHKTHCKHGHEYTPENTRIYKDTYFCRECDRARSRKPKAS